MTSRRRYLGGLAALTALAGCSTGSDGAQSVREHPSGEGIDSQPALGPAPGEAEGTIVAFEDPSCPTCARFERSTFPQLRSNLIDEGRVSFVFRSIPIIYDWGEPATMALEATYDRDESAFWALKSHYYAQQDAFDSDNVLDLTESFLADETGIDAAAVRADTEAGAFQDAVDLDLRASESAGVSATPTLFLFDADGFVTDVSGPVGYDSITGALGL
ncbi:DsbA family protein [Halolamina litorea]|uniref:DsbA family protein n=1 Tax=Halolamina litorea TaxID=1515593 RepID=A0ABD6BPR1_9EURY|nr:thioredoxin domain-containing protein [Halolamina litorea]